MKKTAPLANNSIFERLKLIKECPLCAFSYEKGKVVILEENNSSHLVHITCSKCLGSILHMIVMTPLGASAVGIITDLSAMEVAKLRKQPAVSSDDLLEFHKFIKIKNNFEKIIKII